MYGSRKTMRTILIPLLCAGLLTRVHAEAHQLLPPEPLGKIMAWGQLTGEMVSVTGAKFEFAWKATVKPDTDRLYAAGASLALSQGAPAGHCLALTFTARATKPLDLGQGKILAGVQLGKEPYTSELKREWSLGATWQDCKVAFRTAHQLEPEKHQVVLFFGHGEQVIELANLRLTDLGDLEPASTGLPEGGP